jgi:hypothetical protein
MKMMTCISINPVLCQLTKAQCNNQGVSFSGTVEKLLADWLTPEMRTEYTEISESIAELKSTTKHRNKTGFRGVKERKPHKSNRLKNIRYQAEMCFKGIKKILGTFGTAEEAAKTYDRALVKKTLENGEPLRKIIRVLNFPLENYVTIKK